MIQTRQVTHPIGLAKFAGGRGAGDADRVEDMLPCFANLRDLEDGTFSRVIWTVLGQRRNRRPT